MIFFSARRWLEKQYMNWLFEHEVRDCTFSVISFLASKGYLNEEKVLQEFKERSKEASK